MLPNRKQIRSTAWIPNVEKLLGLNLSDHPYDESPGVIHPPRYLIPVVKKFLMMVRFITPKLNLVDIECFRSYMKIRDLLVEGYRGTKNNDSYPPFEYPAVHQKYILATELFWMHIMKRSISSSMK
jgi:hypothetical protein